MKVNKEELTNETNEVLSDWIVRGMLGLAVAVFIDFQCKIFASRKKKVNDAASI